MTTTDPIGFGPVDYLVVEFPGNKFNGEVLPALVDLVANGIVHILDISFITKDETGAITAVELSDVSDDLKGPLAVFEDLVSILLSDEDLVAVGEALAPNSSAAIIVWENSWALPFAAAVRASGGDFVATGRIPATAIAEAFASTDN